MVVCIGRVPMLFDGINIRALCARCVTSER